MPESSEDCQQIHQEQPKTTNQSMVDYQLTQWEKHVHEERTEKSNNGKHENIYGKI
jgi:hypothetical protein